MKTLTLIRPDDFHVHFRDGELLGMVATHSARDFGRVLVMPNLSPPIETVDQALSYRKNILNAMARGRTHSRSAQCHPLMSLYLTERCTKTMVRKVAATEEVLGYKFYPAHATTQSQFGIRKIDRVFPVLEEMEKKGVYLMIHGEDVSVDIFDREKTFVDKTLTRIVKTFPGLKITLEHITTREAVDFVKEAPPVVRAGVTPHHLLLNRNHLLSEGLNPHYYCMPIVKRESHREAVLQAVLSGNEKFFLGSDSAPHWEKNKLTACGCAGIYSAPVIMSLLAQIFEERGELHRLENFTSVFGARHYGLKPNSETLTLVKKPMRVPKYFTLSKKNSTPKRLIPLRSGETLAWQVDRSA